MKGSFALLFVFLASFLFAGSQTETFPTPFGRFPKECVHSWPSGTQIMVANSPYNPSPHLQVLEPRSSSPISIPALPSCLEAFKALGNRTAQVVNRKSRLDWLDGLLDNAQCTAKPAFYVTNFSAYWDVPAPPAEIVSHGPSSPSTYYYMRLIGQDASEMECTLEYAYGEFRASSWFLTASGSIHQSHAVYGMEKGQYVSGYIVEAGAFLVSNFTMKTVFEKEESSLLIMPSSRYSVAATSTDVYGVDSCSKMCQGSVRFHNIVVKLQEHVVAPPPLQEPEPEPEQEQEEEQEHVQVQVQDPYPLPKFSRNKPTPTPPPVPGCLFRSHAENPNTRNKPAPVPSPSNLYDVWQATSGSTECNGETSVGNGYITIEHRG